MLLSTLTARHIGIRHNTVLPGESGPSGVPGSIQIVAQATQQDPGSIQLGSGETFDLDAIVRDVVDNSIITGLTVTWASSDEGVVTVNASGVVSYVANGTATITASVNSAGGNPVIDIQAVTATSPAAVATLEVTPSTVSGVAGSTATVTYTPKDASGNVLTGRTVTVSTASGSVATQSVSGYTGTITFVAAGSTTAKGTCEGIDSSNVTVTVSAAGGALNPDMPGTITTYRERLWNAQNDANAPGNVNVEGGWYDSTAPGHTWPQVVDITDAVLVADLVAGQVAELYEGTNGKVGKLQFSGVADGTSSTLSSWQNGVANAGFNADEAYVSIKFAPSLNWDQVTSYKLFQFSTHTPGSNANNRVGIVAHIRAKTSSKFGDTTTALTIDIVVPVDAAGNSFERSASFTVVRGMMNHLQIYVKLNTNGQNNGICRMHLNGVQGMNQTAIGYRGGSATILGGDKLYLINLYCSKGGPNPNPPDSIASPCRLYIGYLGAGCA